MAVYAHGHRKRWTCDELLIALNLYHKLTFGQLHARQPAIVAGPQSSGGEPTAWP